MNIESPKVRKSIAFLEVKGDLRTFLHLAKMGKIGVNANYINALCGFLKVRKSILLFRQTAKLLI